MKLLKAIVPPAAEYVGDLEERAARLEIEADEETVRENRAILSEVWPRYMHGASWRGSEPPWVLGGDDSHTPEGWHG